MAPDAEGGGIVAAGALASDTALTPALVVARGQAISAISPLRRRPGGFLARLDESETRCGRVPSAETAVSGRGGPSSKECRYRALGAQPIRSNKGAAHAVKRPLGMRSWHDKQAFNPKPTATRRDGSRLVLHTLSHDPMRC